MANQPANIRDHRSTESYGLGQSGCTAGRRENDASLQFDARNRSFPRGVDEHLLELGTDERFIGRGSSRWAPSVRGESSAKELQPKDKQHAA